MSQSQALSQLQDAFAPFIKSPDELYDIRVQIAKYIESLRPRETTDATPVEHTHIPSNVTGVRRRYLTALHANIAAREEYAALRKQALPEPDHNGDARTPAAAVTAHLDLMQLRRRHRKYQILTRYLAESEKLAEQNNLYDTQNMVNVSSLSPENAHVPKLGDSAATFRAREIIRNLQLAVLQAAHDLKQERQLLENVRASGPPDNPSPEAKLHALIATNAELTNWIEESLAKCDSVNGLNDVSSHSDLAQETGLEHADHERTIRDHYERYLEARTELLDAAAQLMTPLPTTEPSTEGQSLAQIPTEATTNMPDHDPILPYIDSHLLPLLDHQQTLSQSQTHLRSIMTNHARDLTEQLRRLSDESHLLHSYPILARPQRTDAEVNETKRLLHAWKFAMDAAGTATEATMEKQVALGHEAVKEVNHILDALDEQRGMWEKLR